jgi:hypothetical protein
MRERRSGNIWPAWFYSPTGEGIICKTPEEVPDGWARRKPVPYVPREPQGYDKALLTAQLEAKGVTVDPRWGAAHMVKVLND